MRSLGRRVLSLTGSRNTHARVLIRIDAARTVGRRAVSTTRLHRGALLILFERSIDRELIACPLRNDHVVTGDVTRDNYNSGDSHASRVISGRDVAAGSRGTLCDDVGAVACHEQCDRMGSEFRVPERQAWCCLQVKLCDPCLSALYVP